VGIKEIILTHPIAHLRLSIRSVDEVPRAGVHVCQRDACVCRVATSEQLLYSGAPSLSEEKYSVRPRFQEVLPILTTALCLVSVEK
jgi:hypothetical protein